MPEKTGRRRAHRGRHVTPTEASSSGATIAAAPPPTRPQRPPSSKRVAHTREIAGGSGWRLPFGLVERVQVRQLPAVVIVVTMLCVWIYGSTTHFVPCRMDCGEAFDALQYVDNYRLYGLRYGLVQDMATSASPDARPYLYTHNVNVAGIEFTLLEAIGLWPFWSKQLVTLAVFGAGLSYVFRATAYHTRSWLAGLVVLLLFVTDVDHVLAFSLNPLRVWHWLAIFGLIFHVGRLARQPHVAPWLDRLAIVLLACVAFGIGYDFWVTCSGIAAVIYVLCLGKRAFRLGMLLGMFGLVAAFAVPFVLRQVQIMSVLGVSFWIMDVVYSAAIKVSVLSRLIEVPPTAELDAIYQAAGVHRPPATPTSNLAAIMSTLTDMIQYLVLPVYGTLSIWLVVAVTLCTLVGTALLLTVPGRRLVQLLARCNVLGARRAAVVGSVRMVSALVLATIGGLSVFAPLSLHIYLKHEFPLVAAPVLVIKGLVLAAILGLILRWRARWPKASFIAMGMAVFLVFDHLMVQADNLRTRQPMSVAWIPAVSARHQSTFAVSWIPGSASVFLDSWAAGLPPGKEHELAERFASGQPEFKIDDFFLFGERDAEEHPDLYTRPDYWLYFPTEHTHPFDAPAPTCRQDYLGQAISRVRRSSSNVTLMSPLYTQFAKGRPDTILTFGARVERTSLPITSAELLHDGQVVGALNYNCQYGVIQGEYRVPATGVLGRQTFEGRLRLPDGRTVSLGSVSVDIVPDGPVDPPRSPGARKPQPSVDEMISLFSGLPVADRGAGYVIFDLRQLPGRP